MSEMIPLVDIAASYEEIREEVEPIILARLRSGDYIGADTIAAFEREFAAYVGGGVEAVACSSGTDAVELATRVMSNPGDVVVCDGETFVAQIAAVERAGRKAADARVGEQQGPVRMVTWLYGSTYQAEEIALCSRIHGQTLIEDCSQAHGNRRAGTFGDAAAWSCYPSKNLGAAGQAGVATFRDPNAAARARRLREHGYDRRSDRHFERGFNLRMDGIQADVLRVKLKRLDGWTARRREIAKAYCEGLAYTREVALPRLEPDHAWHIYAIEVSDRDAVLAKLRGQGIGAAVHYRRDAFGRETQWSRTTLSLPMYPQITDSQVERVIDAVKAVVS